MSTMMAYFCNFQRSWNRRTTA